MLTITAMKKYLAAALAAAALMLPAVSAGAQDTVKEDSLLMAISLKTSPEEKAEGYVTLSKMFRYSDLGKSFGYAAQAITQSPEGSSARALAYNNMGIVMYYCDNYVDALDNMFKAGEIYSAINDRAGVIRNDMCIGNVYNTMNSTETAMSYYDKALAASIKLSGEDPGYRIMPSLYSCISMAYYNRGEFDKSLAYSKKAFESSEETDDRQNISTFCINIAHSYTSIGMPDSAEVYIAKAEQYSQEEGSTIGRALIFLEYASLYKAEGATGKAVAYLDLAQAAGEEVGSSSILSKVHEMRSQICSDKGDYRNAYLDLIEVKRLSDSLKSEAAVEAALKMKYSNEYRMMEQKIAYHREKTRLKTAIMGSISVLLAVLLVVVLILVRTRISKLKLEKDNLRKDLELKNKELVSKIMFLMEKNELINGYTRRLVDIMDTLKGEQRQKLQSLICEMRSSVEGTGMWDTFEKYFNNVYESFYINLKKDCPDLTPTELKVCALLRLNLSSKEISSLMNLSPGSVDVARAKIRKKLNITDTKENLVSFLLRY